MTGLLALSCTLEGACKLKAIVVMCREWSTFFFACGSGGGTAGGGGRLLPIPLMVEVVIFLAFGKCLYLAGRETPCAQKFWHMLLPLIT